MAAIVGLVMRVVISLGFDLGLGVGLVMAMAVSFSLFSTLSGRLWGGYVYMGFRFGGGDEGGFLLAMMVMEVGLWSSLLSLFLSNGGFMVFRGEFAKI